MGARGLVLLRPEEAAAGRLETEDLEVARRDEHPGRAQGLVAAGEVHRPPLVDRQAVEGAALPAQVEEVRVGVRHPVDELSGVVPAAQVDPPGPQVDPHQRVGVGDRQRPQEQPVEEGEDGGVEADPEDQGEERRGGEARLPQKQPQPEGHVARQMPHRSRSNQHSFRNREIVSLVR